jgi:hypothetical protein
MKLSYVTDSLGHRPFEEMLDIISGMGQFKAQRVIFLFSKASLNAFRFSLLSKSSSRLRCGAEDHPPVVISIVSMPMPFAP